MKIKNYLIILLIIVNSLTTLSQNTSNKINNNLSQCTYTVVGYLQSATNPQYQPVQDNSQWHYIAVTKNGLNGKIYLDGNLISNSTYANNPYIWNSLLLGATQGCIACAPSSNYVGQIDDLRISNIERTATQIANYYNSNQPFNADSNTIGIYNFDVPNGSILQSTGIGNNGVLYGGANYIQGKFGQALNLDGIDDYARITQSLPTNNITIEFWFKSSDTSASMAMLEYAYNTGIYLTSNTCPTEAPTGNSTQIFCATPTPTISQLTATGTNLQWYTTANGGSPLSSTSTLNDGTTYFASQTLNGIESTDRLAVTVDINDPQITASAATICSGTAVTLTASTPATPIANNCTLPTNLQNGLVGYWPFCGNANDVSGNGNNGTVNGATLTDDRFGNANSAYSFDGVNDYIEGIQSNFPLGSSQRSISGWINMQNLPLNYTQSLLSYGYGGPNPGTSQNMASGLWIFNTMDNLCFWGSFNDHYGSYTFNGNSWYFVTATVNEVGISKLYVNGINIGTANLGSLNTILNSGVFRIGKSTHTSNNGLAGFVSGVLDDLSVYNRVLTQSEITQLYNARQATYLWSTGATTANINPTPTATTTYWCDVTVNGVTCRKEVTITVNSTTPAPTGNATQVFCVTPAPTVASLTATGTAVQWYATATGGTPLVSTTALVDGTTYYASQTVNGCESSDRLSVTVDFNDPQITASATTICSGTAVSLSVNYMPSTNVLIDRVDLFEYSYNFISNWMNNIGGWTSGLSPFAYDLDNQPIGNLLRANSIWPIGTTMYIRKQVNLSNYDLNSITYKVAVDNGFKLYVNGNLVANENIGGYTYLWEYQGNIPSNYLNNGNNIFAFELIDDGASNVFASKIEGNFINNINLLWSTGETTSTINPNPTTTNTYWCDVTINGVTCRKEITINVNPNITPTFTQVVAICSGATLTALPTTSNNGITGTWSPALNNTATTTYTFTPTAGQCATTTTMTITVNPNITPTFTQVAAICSGATLSALPTTSNNGITGTWSPALNNTATTTYTFTPTACQCDTTATMTVTVNPNITPTFTQVTAICSGATLTALPTTSNNGITGTWSPALNNTATTTYTFTPTVSQCATTATMTITVNPNITPTFTQVSAICSGATLSALPTNSNNGINGTWLPTLDNTATTTYTFTPTAGQCATTATMTITVNPNITPTFTQVTAICSGATLTALPTTSNNGITGTWSPALNNTTTTTYTFTPTAGQCATTATMTITVNPNITPTFTQVTAICSGATLTALPTSSNNGITGTWSPALDNTATTTYTFTPTAGQCATTATMTITVNPNITPTFTQVAAICSGATLTALPTTSNNGITGTWLPALDNTATTTYTFTPTAGQCATTATMTITVNPNITPTFTQVAAICSGATLTALPTTSNNGITGTWSPALNNTATTTYTFTPTAGQCATTATMTITVNPNITPTFTQVAAICSGATLTALPTTSNNGITGTWSPALDNTATTTYTFTPTAGQCATTATMTITVNPLPNEPTGNNQPIFCAIDNPTINDLVLNTNNIHWYLNATGGNILANNYLLTDGQILYAAAYDAITLCESNTRYQVIVSVENPTLPIFDTKIEFCKELNATVSSIDTQGVSMVWYDSPTGNTTIPLDYILQDGDVLYGAAFNASTNCESTERVMIQISILDTALDYYNLITIDDNQRNTALKIIGIERFASNSIEIYNRYGTLVWSAINYDNSINAFKGMANVSGVVSKNSYLPSGTYFFILKYPNSCKQTELKGYIHLENKK
jgi:serine protease inhibitor